MLKLLNRGLNLSILPHKLDITQTLVEYRKFERAIIWHEFFFGNETDSEIKEHIFRTEKTNMPKNYNSPEGLKIFLSSIKSEIQDPRNRNAVPCNLPDDEMNALKEINKLQRERQIVVKACDKGAGVIILNFKDYMKTCYNHLSSRQADNKPYYTEVNDIALDIAKNKIKNVLDKGLEEESISKSEYDAMIAENKKPGRFYCNLKVHKPHDHIPPPRPIISGSESITENIGTFVEHHIHDEATKHKAFLQDTPHFLRIIERINKGEKLHPKTMAVTMDVTSLYTNIIHKEGLSSLQNTLQKRKKSKSSYKVSNAAHGDSIISKYI